MHPGVRLDGVVKQFGTTRALDRLSLVIPRGTMCGVIGPSGAGKTTAIRMIMSILFPDEGHDEGPRPAVGAARPRTASATSPRSAASTARCRSVRFCPIIGQLKGVAAAKQAATRVHRCSRGSISPARRGEEVRGHVEGHAAARPVRRRHHQPAGPADSRRAVQRPRPGERPVAQDIDRRGASPRRNHPVLHPRDGPRRGAV